MNQILYRRISAILIAISLTVSLCFGNVMGVASASETKDKGSTVELTDEQKNSIAMLNYLTVLTTEINESKNSRLYLENAYSSLINSTNPEVVDVKTQNRLDHLLDMIEKYRMIDVKRDRLQYIYEQNRAKAIRAAVPNPLGLLSATNTFSLSGLVASGLYMTVDSVTSYKNAKNELEMKYLEDGWALDDEQAENLHDMRKSSFNYMIEIVRDNKLPGKLALSEDSVNDFVKWENKKSSDSKLQFLLSTKDSYKAFGRYWLALARAYYDNKNYAKCIEALNEYEKMDVNIFREDYKYAEALPLGVASLSELYKKKKIKKAYYVKKSNHYLSQMINNSDKDNWGLRYFAAQAYIELDAITKDSKYLKKAYDLTLDSVNYLVEPQLMDNEIYMADVKEREVPDKATKQEKKDVKNYNKLLKEKRKTELPPVNEPLALNCDLLFGLAKEIGISQNEKKRIDGILHEDGKALFLVQPLDNTYRFTKGKSEEPDSIIEFKKDQIKIPADYVSSNSSVTVKVIDNGKTSTYNDWTVKKVKRGKDEEIETFEAVYEGKKIKKQDFSDNTKVQVTIDPQPGSSCKKIKREYQVDNHSKVLFVDRTSFSEGK